MGKKQMIEVNELLGMAGARWAEPDVAKLKSLINAYVTVRSMDAEENTGTGGSIEDFLLEHEYDREW